MLEAAFASGSGEALAGLVRQTKDPAARQELLEVLSGRLRADQALPLLRESLEKVDSEALEVVQLAIQRSATESVLQEIADLFDQSTNQSTREQLVRIVQGIRNPEAIPALAELASGIETGELGSDHLATAALNGLASMGNIPSTRALFLLLDRQTRPELQVAVGETLLLDPLPAAIEAFKSAAAGDKTAMNVVTRLYAVKGLQRLGTLDAYEALNLLAGDPDPRIREASSRALEKRPNSP